MATSLADAIAEVDGLRGRGDLLLAFDRAGDYLKSWPESEALRHRALLALARAGATEQAARLFAAWKLDGSVDPEVLALAARLAKDRALKLRGGGRNAALQSAAELYRRLDARPPGYYPAINAATLTALAGDRQGAARLAGVVLQDPAVLAGADYWALVSAAEAELLCGRRDAATAALTAAAALSPHPGDMASTRRQLRLILAQDGATTAESEFVLAPLAAPWTLHYLSNAGSPGNWPAHEGESVAEMQAQIAMGIASRPLGSVFGSLGTPAELLFAEASLGAGAQLDLVLPVPAAHLRELVAASGGEPWAARFDRCVAEARRVVLASDDPDTGDFGHLAYALRVAMGLTLLRAQHIDGPALQVLLDEATSYAASAPGAEWLAGGRQRLTLRFRQPAAVPSIPVPPPRQTRAVVFGDLPGFSQLREDQLPVFVDKVMRAVGSVIDEGGPHVELRNTWGDAIHLVLDDVRAAAHICLGVQDALARVDGRLLAREAPPVMRIGAHYGPVFSGWDAVVHQTTYYGRALTKAARIEPITLPGAVYVSEAFAAILLLETGQEFTCTYVGVVPLAKGFGEFRMYDLALS